THTPATNTAPTRGAASQRVPRRRRAGLDEAAMTNSRAVTASVTRGLVSSPCDEGRDDGGRGAGRYRELRARALRVDGSRPAGGDRALVRRARPPLHATRAGSPRARGSPPPPRSARAQALGGRGRRGVGGGFSVGGRPRGVHASGARGGSQRGGRAAPPGSSREGGGRV